VEVAVPTGMDGGGDIALFILGLTLVKCTEILKFERATQRVLRQFHDLLFTMDDPERQDRNRIARVL
jgi:hypothetical protein